MRKHLLSLALAVSAASVGVGGCHHEAPPAKESSITSLSPQSFKQGWTADLDLKNDPVVKVVLVQDQIFVYSKKNNVFGLERSSGKLWFTRHVSDTIVPMYDPVVLKDRIIFPTDSTLEIYRRDGRFERRYTPSAALSTSAAGQPNGSMLVVGVDARGAGRVVAIETAPGKYKPVDEKWQLMSNSNVQVTAGPAIQGGVVYAAFNDGQVMAVNADTRASIWETSTGQTFRTFGPVNADLRVDDFGVYVPSTDSKLYCLDKTQGRQKWVYYAGAPLRSSPAVTASTIYLPVSGKGVSAIDKTNGTLKWAVRDAVKFLAEDEKYAYFQRSNNSVVAVDRSNGEQRFTSKRTDLVQFATNTKDSTIYAATKDGKLMAISPVLKPGDTGEVALDLDARAVDVVAMR